MHLKMRNGNVAIVLNDSGMGRSSGGIFLPTSENKKGVLRIGKIVEVGPGELVQGQFVKPELEKGDEVVFDSSHSEPLSVNGDIVWICNMVDVTAIITQKHLSVVPPAPDTESTVIPIK